MWVMVALGAAVGAPLRYLTDQAVQRRWGAGFPWGTMTVNVAGSFALGVVAGWPLPAGPAALVGTGFCGALTTYSTFGYETVQLLDGGARLRAVANVVGSVLVAGTAGLIGLTAAGAIAAYLAG